MLTDVFLWGAATGLIHFVVTGALYGNPFIGKLYQKAQVDEPGVRQWPNQGKYLITQFLGTQVEIYILAFTYLFLRSYMPWQGYTCALILGAFFSGIRVYPRFWNMWIQSTYPKHLLLIEFINGIVSTFTITLMMEVFV